MPHSAIRIIEERFSCRAYLDRSVSLDLIKEILRIARQAPSSTNMQPWEVLVITGESKKKMDQAYLQAYDAQAFEPIDMETYLDRWVDPYKTRRVRCGLQLYESLGIDRDDKQRRGEQSRKNFNAFGAPVALVFLMPKMMKEGSLLDMGLFIQTIMLAAQARGLNTCAQASLVAFPSILRKMFNISDDKRLVTGMALGYGDLNHPINTYRTEREQVEKFTTFFE